MTSIWDPRTLERNFDSINQTDFLWQHDSGQAAVWLLNGTSFVSGRAVGPNVGPSWHLQGDGDFNTDGRSDFLWQNDNGQAAVWLMNGTSLIGGAAVGPEPRPILARDRFRRLQRRRQRRHPVAGQQRPGRGLADERSEPGRRRRRSGPTLAHPGTSIDPAISTATATSDILWQNDNGQAAIWLMNGTSLVGGGAVGPNPGADWHVIKRPATSTATSRATFSGSTTTARPPSG